MYTVSNAFTGDYQFTFIELWDWLVRWHLDIHVIGKIRGACRIQADHIEYLVTWQVV